MLCLQIMTNHKVQFCVMPISLGVLDIVKAGAHRLLLVQYTRGLYDPGPGTGSVENKINQVTKNLPNQSINQSINLSISQSINQSISQSISQSVSQSTNQ